MKYQKLINTNIKRLRQKHNLTQDEFAEKINITNQGLSNLERNRYQPTSETIDKICKTFEISPVELLLMETNQENEIIGNITHLLSNCSKKKLKYIYEIITILIKV